MVKTVETFKKKLKSTVEQDISNLLENVADACPVALADLGDGYARNAEVIKKLLGNRKYVELERLIVSLRDVFVQHGNPKFLSGGAELCGINGTRSICIELSECPDYCRLI